LVLYFRYSSGFSHKQKGKCIWSKFRPNTCTFFLYKKLE
jgi:hypothetical protein